MIVETVIIIRPIVASLAGGHLCPGIHLMKTWTAVAGFRVFRVTSATNYRSMSGDCETLLGRAAVIKAIRDKFPTRAL